MFMSRSQRRPEYPDQTRSRCREMLPSVSGEVMPGMDRSSVVGSGRGCYWDFEDGLQFPSSDRVGGRSGGGLNT